MTVSRSRASERASERRAKRRVPSSGGGALRVIRTVNLGETKREGEVPSWDERAGARARSSARKTWSGNTIDERSIARSAHPRHLETSLSSSSSPLSFSLIGYRLFPLLLQLPHLSRRVSFHLFELLRDSYVTSGCTRIRASCYVRSLNWVSIFTSRPPAARPS